MVEQAKWQNHCKQDLQQYFPDWLDTILKSRGVFSPKQLDYKLSELLHPKDLKNIDSATALIIATLDKDLPISIVGDYDVDGATGTALAVKALKAFGSSKTDYLIPDRFTDGYGFNVDLVERLHQRGCKLVITVDNGITSTEAVARAQQLGIRIIITDHHLPKNSALPQADAIINPNQPGCSFASKNLAGVGVVFYLLSEVKTKLQDNHWFIFRKLKPPNMADFLDLVAIGTLADMAILDYNNRVLIEYGLRKIRQGKATLGIRSLLQRSAIAADKCTSRDISFSIAPPLNSAGRLYTMGTGVECLLTNNWSKANKLAEQLIAINNERKAIQIKMTKQANELIDELYPDGDFPELLVLHSKQWHQGLTGLVAGNIKDAYDTSCIVLAEVSDELSKGSGRAKNNLHLLKLLEQIDNQYPDILVKFGGHAVAAGMTIGNNKIEQLRQVINQQSKARLDQQTKTDNSTDGSLAIENINKTNALLIEGLGPWGQGFEEPLFDGEFDLIEQSIIASRHLLMVLAREEQTFSAIAFNIDTRQWPNPKAQKIKVSYHLHINRYQRKEQLQLTIASMTLI